jgi:hypothetical protein
MPAAHFDLMRFGAGQGSSAALMHWGINVAGNMAELPVEIWTSM